MSDQGHGQMMPAQRATGGWSGRAEGDGRLDQPGLSRSPEGGTPPDVLTDPARWEGTIPFSDYWAPDHEGPFDPDDDGAAHGDPPMGEAILAIGPVERQRMRAALREFLRAVPRREEKATLALVRPDGKTRILTRGELSAAIDRLRPRQRQIIRLAIEERWPRQRVCEYLRHISLKTFERDQIEGLDLLAQL
jgi:hypothetical protein